MMTVQPLQNHLTYYAEYTPKSPRIEGLSQLKLQVTHSVMLERQGILLTHTH